MGFGHHYLYILRCADGTLIVGTSADVQRVVQRINSGKDRNLKGPVFLVHTEEYMNEHDAEKRATLIRAMESDQQERLVSTLGIASLEFAMTR